MTSSSVGPWTILASTALLTTSLAQPMLAQARVRQMQATSKSGLQSQWQPWFNFSIPSTAPIPWGLNTNAVYGGNVAQAATSIDQGATWTGQHSGTIDIVWPTSFPLTANNTVDIWIDSPTAQPGYAWLRYRTSQSLTSFVAPGPATWSVRATLRRDNVLLTQYTTSTSSYNGSAVAIEGATLLTLNDPNVRYRLELQGAIDGAIATGDTDISWELVDIAAPLPEFLAVTYGVGTPGTGGVTPTLRSPPTMQPSFELELGDALAGTFALLAMFPSGPGPIPITSTLSIDLGLPVLMFPTELTDAAGNATWSVPIPSSLALPFEAWFQSFVLDLNASDRLAKSNGLRITIG